MRFLRLALLVALPLAAHATVDSVPGTCPVDDEPVEVPVLLSTNSLLGHDRDLCPHAAGDDEIREAISGCRKCGFAGVAKEFHQPLRDDVKAKILKELQPAASPWERYANRARILEWSEASPQMIGESWLRAAWSVRLDERPIGEPVASAIHRLLGTLPADVEKGDQLLGPARAFDKKLAAEKDMPPDDRAAAQYASATFWRARGEFDMAETRYASALIAAKDPEMAAALKDATSRDNESIELEKGYLKKALAHFRAGLAQGEKVPKQQRGILALVAAECARRTGAREEAQRLYKIAEPLADSPELEPLVKQGLADTAPPRKGKSK